MPLIAATRPTWLGTRSARPTGTPPWHTALTPTAQHLLAVPGSLRTWGGSLEAVRGQTLLPPLLWKARTGSALGLWSVFFLWGVLPHCRPLTPEPSWPVTQLLRPHRGAFPNLTAPTASQTPSLGSL